MKKTFNTVHFGKKAEFGGHFPVWARIENTLVAGGHFAGSNPLTGKAFAAGDLIPAGTMVHYSTPGGVLTIIPNNASEDAVKTVNGLVENDVMIPEDFKLATAAVVVKGRIYADRVFARNADGDPVGTIGLPAAVEAQLPMIEFVRE